MKNLYILLVLMMALASCNQNRVYEKYQGTPGLEWKKSDKKEFKVDITDTSVKYNIIIAVRHAQGFPLKYLHVDMKSMTPSKKETLKTYRLEVIGDNDQYNGKGMGDIWDLEIPVEEGVSFIEEGTYVFEIVHKEKNDPVAFIMEVGLIIDKAVE